MQTKPGVSEDVGKLGASLMTDLGVPVGKSAVHSSGSGYCLGLLDGWWFDSSGKTLLRVSPMLAKLGGSLGSESSVDRGGTGKGKSPQVAEETASAVMGVMANLPLQQLVRTMRVLKRDRTYNPFQYDEQGRATQRWRA